jgi:hypothetical protein
MSGRRRFISPKWFHRPTRLCFRAFDAMKLMTSGASPIAQMSGAVFSATPPAPRWPRPSASAARAAPDHRLRDDHRSMLEVPASNDELKALLTFGTRTARWRSPPRTSSTPSQTQYHRSVCTLRFTASLVRFQVSSFLTAFVLSFRPLALPTSANRPLDTFDSPAGGDCCWTCSRHETRRRLREVLFAIGQFLIASTGRQEHPR